MIGDIILIDDLHKQKAQEIASNVEKRDVIAIYGRSGTGKTEVAVCLENYLSKERLTSFTVSIDDYYVTNWKERVRVRRKKGIDYVGLKEINWLSLKQLVESFKVSQPLRFQRIYKNADKLEFGFIDSKDIDVLIIEGLYAGYLKKFNLISKAFFLEGNNEQTYEFRKARMKENPDNEFRQQILEKEARVVGQLRQYADIIIPFKGDKNGNK